MSEVKVIPCRFCGTRPHVEKFITCHSAICMTPDCPMSIRFTPLVMWNKPNPITDKLWERIAALEAENIALREATRWIPVSERLPEDGQNVAALDNTDHCVDVWRYSSLIEDYFSRHFSHWMPWSKWLENTK